MYKTWNIDESKFIIDNASSTIVSRERERETAMMMLSDASIQITRFFFQQRENLKEESNLQRFYHRSKLLSIYYSYSFLHICIDQFHLISRKNSWEQRTNYRSSSSLIRPVEHLLERNTKEYKVIHRDEKYRSMETSK